MNNLVTQIVNDDGEKVSEEDQCWHLMGRFGGDNGVLCTGEFVDSAAASGNGSEYKFKDVLRGGITCKRCLQVVKEFKAIKL